MKSNGNAERRQTRTLLFDSWTELPSMIERKELEYQERIKPKGQLSCAVRWAQHS